MPEKPAKRKIYSLGNPRLLPDHKTVGNSVVYKYIVRNKTQWGILQVFRTKILYAFIIPLLHPIWATII
jgi:hypothetical protein